MSAMPRVRDAGSENNNNNAHVAAAEAALEAVKRIVLDCCRQVRETASEAARTRGMTARQSSLVRRGAKEMRELGRLMCAARTLKWTSSSATNSKEENDSAGKEAAAAFDMVRVAACSSEALRYARAMVHRACFFAGHEEAPLFADVLVALVELERALAAVDAALF
jgi:hypothetical protein